MVDRRTVIAGAALAATGLAAGGCAAAGASTSTKWGHPGTGGSPSPSSAARVTVTPAANAANVSPTETVVVTVQDGTLQSVVVTGAGGKQIAGALDADSRTWRSTGPLAYDQTYTVAATVVDAKGGTAQNSSTFKTVKPTATVGVNFLANLLVGLKTGGTYGVGLPVQINFSRSVTDKAAAVAALQVVASPPVEGRWHWLDSRNVHWRPKDYWQPGTKVTVNANLLGVALGNGVYGAANTSTHFSIGPSRIAIADNNTHYMQCYIGGQMVKNIPVSLGKGGTTKGSQGETIDFNTHNGVHVVLQKTPNTRMTSASYGITDKKDPNYYDEVIQLTVRISYSGEFVHMADWNIPSQGKVNTSHGCINVGPAYASWFYNTFDIGDVVVVKNSPRPLTSAEGLSDWNIAWSNW